MKKSLYSPGQKQIAETIKAMRQAGNLTQRALAARLKRPLNVVSRIEAEQRRVDLLEWIALCEACGVDPVEAGRTMLEALVRGLPNPRAEIIKAPRRISPRGKSGVARA